MLPPWRSELKVGLGRTRLVAAPAARALDGDPARALADLGSKARVTVVLSSDLVRYAVLPWSPELKTRDEWLAFARHVFAGTHGPAAAGWSIKVSAAGARESRVATAVDTEVLEALRGNPAVASIQPYLMSAFNARRRLLREKASWFVLQEPMRLTIGLYREGAWRLIRSRQVPDTWTASLADLIDRERAAGGDAAECDHVYLYAESEAPPLPGRYRITDVTLPRGANSASRPLAMTLH